jgi:Protein of unknown function (DUF1353)
MDTEEDQGTLGDVLAEPGGDDRSEKAPWCAAFTVDDSPDGRIRLEQVTAKDFLLRSKLSFVGDMGLAGYPDITDDMRADARFVDQSKLGDSDLASVPLFLRWFEGPYGRHTPAALIHDYLIMSGEPNGGALKDDAASDRYFRFMLKAVGVPFFKRWIMWAAVAMRTRWAVGGGRRISLVAWLVIALAGVTAFVVAAAAIVTGGEAPGDVDKWALLGVSLVVAVGASVLWGRQIGAGLVAAAAALWILPPTVVAALGYAVYWVLERLARAIGGPPDPIERVERP